MLLALAGCLVSTGPSQNLHPRQQQHSDSDSVSGIMFALKHWICKHYYVLAVTITTSMISSTLSLQHFQEKPELDEKLQQLLKEALECALLTNTEIRIVNEMSRQGAALVNISTLSSSLGCMKCRRQITWSRLWSHST